LLVSLRHCFFSLVLACLLALPSSVGLAEGGLSAECLAFQRDPDADLGAVLKAGCKPTTGQMSRLMDNPLGNVAMWINQIDLYSLTNDTINKNHTEYQANYMGIIQFPKSVSENWTVINRIVYSIPSSPLDQGKVDKFEEDFGGGQPLQPPEGPIQPPSSGAFPIDALAGRTTGFGDMYYVGLLAPKESISLGPRKNLLWGIGLDLGFPTATDDLLGAGKWTAGPTGILVYMGPKWKVGALVQNYFSYAGKARHDDVSLMNLQYFIYYSLSDTMSIGAGPNIVANWEAAAGDKWTVPLGIGINKTIQFGKLPIRFGIEYHYNVVRPDTVGADWDLRFMIIPAMPSALFSWM
jgi:hypothetical protein